MTSLLALVLILVNMTLTAFGGEDACPLCEPARSGWKQWLLEANAAKYVHEPRTFLEDWYMKAAALANCMTSCFHDAAKQEDHKGWRAHEDAIVPDDKDKDRYRIGPQPFLEEYWKEYGAEFVPLEVNEEARAYGTTYLAKREIERFESKGICCLKPIAWTIHDEEMGAIQYVCRENAMLWNFAADDQWHNPEQNDSPMKKSRLNEEESDVGECLWDVFPDPEVSVSFVEDLNKEEVHTEDRIIPPNKVSFITEDLFLSKVNSDGEKRAVPCKAKGSLEYLYGTIAIMPAARKVGAEAIPLPWTSLLHNEEMPIQFGRVAGPKAFYLGIRFHCNTKQAEEDELGLERCANPELWAMHETTTFDKTELRPLHQQEWKTADGGHMVFTKPHGTDVELIVLLSILGGLMVILIFGYCCSPRSKPSSGV